MKMTDTGDKNRNTADDMGEAMLEDMFAAAKRHAPQPDSAMMARILADAEAVQLGFPAPGVLQSAPRRGVFEGVFEMLGGWAGLGGLATASAFGLWLGISPVMGVGDSFGLPALGSSAALDSLGDDYEYLAALGEF